MSFVVPKLLLNMIYGASFTFENITFWTWCDPHNNKCRLKVIVNGNLWTFSTRKDTVDKMFNLVRALIEYARPSIDFDKCEAYTSLIQFVNLNFVLRIPGSQTTEVPKHGSRTKAALRVSEDTE